MKPKFTRELADKIKDIIIEYQEYFAPYIFEDVVVVGGIRNRGYSDADIDIAILWNIDHIETPEDLKYLDRNRIMDHLVNYWLKLHFGDDVIDYLDIYSYIRHSQTDFVGKNVMRIKTQKLRKALDKIDWKEMKEEGLWTPDQLIDERKK